MKNAALFLLLLLPSFAFSQTIELPAEVKGTKGQFIRVPAKTDGTVVMWYSLDEGLNVFPVELLKDSKTAVVSAPADGRYRLLAYTALKDSPSLPSICVVVVGNPEPAPPGPGPKPPIPPKPVDPAPIPLEGFRVLIVTETSEKLTPTQSSIIFGEKVRSYLREKAVKGPMNTPEFRVFDKDADLTAEAKHWQDAIRRPRTSLPWLIISNGTYGYEGPLPASIEETLTLLKKFGG